MKSSAKVIMSKKLNKSMLVSPDPKSRLKLEDIFHRLAKDRKKTVYGEREHAKFEGWFYKVDYDVLDMSRGREDELLCYGDDISNSSFRHKLTDSEPSIPKLFMGYSIKTPYFEERIAFLRTLDNQIARELIEVKSKEWSQGDEKKTFVSTSFSLAGFDDMLPFLRAHIKDTVERH